MRELHPWTSIQPNIERKLDIYLTKRTIWKEMHYFYRKVINDWKKFRRKY